MGNKLPQNWVETELGEILKLKNGYAFKTKDYREEGIPLVRIGNIQQGNVSTEKSIYVDKIDSAEGFIIEKGDVLVAMSGATTGKYGVFNEDIKAYQNQRVGNLKPFAPALTSKQFIYYLLGGLKKEIEDKAYGGAQPNISPKLIEKIKIGFPPLAEQQRIVAKLDDLFGHLDTLKTRLNHIPQILKNFRQAVLTQAVTGKLTEEWRVGRELASGDSILSEMIDLKNKLVEEKIIKRERVKIDPINDNEIRYKVHNWKWCRMIQVATLITDGKHGDCRNDSDSGYYFLSVKNMKNGELIYSNGRQILKEDFEEVHKRTNLEAGDILISSTGATIGKIAIAKDLAVTPKTTFQKSVAIVKNFKEHINSEFLKYYLEANMDLIRGVSTGTAQPNLLLGDLKKFLFIIPPKEEQTEIVKRVEHLFAKADTIEAQYQSLKTKIDSLPQAILAKAFKGELVEQLDTDGDAQELLEEIKALKAEVASNTKKRIVKKKK